MKITDEKIEELLRGQMWVEPSADFTAMVMNRIAEEPAMDHVPAARRTRWYEAVLMGIPVVVLLVMVLQRMQQLSFIGEYATDQLREVGFWLVHTTGIPWFAAYPILFLGVLGPILAGAVASCALSSHCRIARALVH